MAQEKGARLDFLPWLRRRLGLPALLALAWTGAVGAAGPADSIDAFHAALKKGDRAAALAQLAPTLVVYESGFSEHALAEYSGEHLAADLAFGQQTTRTLKKRDAFEAGETAWVISEYEVKGTFEQQQVNLVSAETAVLKRVDGAWKVVHIHWSGHSAE